MTAQTFVLLSGLLSFGVPLVLAIRELVVIPAPSRRDDDEPPPRQRAPASPRPLPACLLPETILSAAHDRRPSHELEDA